MIMIVWVNRRVYYEHYLVRKKKRNTAIIMKITWYTKKKVENIMNIMVHQKSSSPRLWTYLVHEKIIFETLWSYLVSQKKILRKVCSYFVNLLQNNKKFAVTLYLKSFCEHLTKVLLTFRRIGDVVMNAQRFIKSNR